MNVLVVIDVQNCFMFHNDGDTTGKGGTFLNAGEEASKEIIKELETLVDGKSHVVFSRDFHPMNHISLEGYESREINPGEGIWPKHCRNKRVQCGSRVRDKGSSNTDVSIPNKLVKTTTGELTESSGPETLEVIGTELSYMFFTNDKFREPVKRLIEDNRKGESKIGLGDTLAENGTEIKTTPADASRTVNYDEPPIVDDKTNIKYITLTKGERCDKEAYSAFNYHIVYNSSDPSDPSHPVKSNIKPDDAANSTGLWEWILKNRGVEKEITITVCGLVGNVCVMHSLLQGIALWNNVYSKQNPDVKVKFVYSLKGTRFAEAVPPLKVKPNFDEDDIVGHFNHEDSRPEGMGVISIINGQTPINHSNQVTSFEVLNYEGQLNKIGSIIDEDISNIYEGANMVGGRRRRRSVRRGKNKSRKSQKYQRGRRTYKNKRRITKRRS
jgi:nicotinamidase-related amidase